MISTKQARTAGTIAAELGVPLHRVQYILRTRKIQPVAKAGVFNLYSAEHTAEVRRHLNIIDARRSQRREKNDYHARCNNTLRKRR